MKTSSYAQVGLELYMLKAHADRPSGVDLDEEVEYLSQIPIRAAKPGYPDANLLAVCLDVATMREEDECIEALFITLRKSPGYTQVVEQLERSCPFLAAELIYAWSKGVMAVHFSHAYDAESSYLNAVLNGSISNHEKLQIKTKAIKNLSEFGEAP